MLEKNDARISALEEKRNSYEAMTEEEVLEYAIRRRIQIHAGIGDKEFIWLTPMSEQLIAALTADGCKVTEVETPIPNREHIISWE